MGALSSATLRLRICRPCWGASAPGRPRPAGGTSSCGPLTRIPCWVMISEDSFGKKSLLSVLPVGSIFGESYTCAKARNRTIAYQARTHSRVLLLDYGRILHACKLVCRFHHRMIENMVELIAEKNLTLVEKLEVVSRTTIREKLLTYLARQAEAAGARTFTIPMGRTALAEYLCTDRSAMTRELARMRDEGLIDYTKRTFTLRQ